MEVHGSAILSSGMEVTLVVGERASEDTTRIERIHSDTAETVEATLALDLLAVSVVCGDDIGRPT